MSGKYIKCETVDQKRKVLEYLHDNGVEFNSGAVRFLSSAAYFNMDFPYVTYNKSDGTTESWRHSKEATGIIEYSDIQEAVEGMSLLDDRDPLEIMSDLMQVIGMM